MQILKIRQLDIFSRNFALPKFLKNPLKRSKPCLPHSRHPTLACSPPEEGKMKLRLLSSRIYLAREAFLNTAVKIVAFVRIAFVFGKIKFFHLICKDIFERCLYLENNTSVRSKLMKKL